MRRSTILIAALFIASTAPAWCGGGRVRLSGSPISIAHTRSAITVDGDLREWDPAAARSLVLVQNPGDVGHPVYDDDSAKVAFAYDSDALYVAAWWNDPTPLGPQKTAGSFPGGDALILHIQLKNTTALALWRDAGGTAARSVVATGSASLDNGKAATGVTQGFKLTGPHSYSQEARIPWSVLGGQPVAGSPLRIGIDLAFGGLDPTAGYKAYVAEMAKSGSSQNRWGANIGYGFQDGVAKRDQLNETYDPNSGALVKLVAAGTVAPTNPVTMFDGSERTRTTDMIATPAAKSLSVDGKLSPGEWDDRTATTIAYEPSMYPGKFSVRICWAYDDKGLYAGLRWFTRSPHANYNAVSGAASLGRGYDGGDSLNLRLATDRVSHSDIWVHDATRETGFNITYGAKFDEGKVPDALAKGAKAAITNRDGGGYDEEIFLPWSLITKTGAALKEGDSFRTMLDVFFNGGDGNRLQYILAGSLAQATGVVALPFTAPRDGYYTVNIERTTPDPKNGIVVRHLLSYARMRTGEKIDWDGLDDSGAPVPAGAYHFRGLSSTGIGLKYLTTFNSPAQPPWETNDGTGDWGGDHSPPFAVAADDTGVFLGWPGAEDGYGLMKTDFAGKRQWGRFGYENQTSLIALDSKYVYTLNVNGIVCRDRATGNRAGFSMVQKSFELGDFTFEPVQRYNWGDVYNTLGFSLQTYANNDDYYYSWHTSSATALTGEKNSPHAYTGLAAGGGKIFLAVRNGNAIAVYNAADMTRTDVWTIPHPAGLAYASSTGTLYAISDNSVVRVNTATGIATRLVTNGLDAPVGLALDAAGNLYVSDWGKAMCVKVFTPRGEPIRTIGKLGGRPWVGNYDENGMLLPRGLAVDKNGMLWVAEDDNMPRRISVWNATTGQFVREFVGSTTYGGVSGGSIDPVHSDRAVSAGVLFQIDLNHSATDGKGYKPIATLWRRTSRDAFFAFGPTVGMAGGRVHFIDYQGRRFLASVAWAGSPIILGELRADNTWHPLAAAGLCPVAPRVDEPKLQWGEQWWPEVFRGHDGQNYVWTDINSDGLVQPGEMQWRTGLGGSAYWGSGTVDDKLTLQFSTFAFKVLGFETNGAPKYDINQAERIAIDLPYSAQGVTVDKSGQLITVRNGERRSAKNRTVVAAYGTDGVHWLYDTVPDVRPMGAITGEAPLGPVDAGRELGEIFGITQWHGLFVPLLTTDGLFVGRLLRDPTEGGAPGPDVYMGETIQGLSRVSDGRIILCHGKNAHNLMEVTGLDTVRRFAGDFTLTDAGEALARKRLADADQQTKATAPIGIALDKRAVTDDGKLDEWDTAKMAPIGAGVPRAEIGLRTDGKMLSIAFRVYKAGGFINKGIDDYAGLFLTGDAVDLQFTTDPAANPKRTSATMGDTRLIISQLAGRPVAVLYRTEVPLATAPVKFNSPARTVVFDSVTVVKEAQIAIQNTPDGYIVEATLPTKAMIGDLWPGRVLGGDAGIIVADATGRRVARTYRFNKNTGIVNDVPTEAALTPAEWGEIEVARQETAPAPSRKP